MLSEKYRLGIEVTADPLGVKVSFRDLEDGFTEVTFTDLDLGDFGEGVEIATLDVRHCFDLYHGSNMMEVRYTEDQVDGMPMSGCKFFIYITAIPALLYAVAYADI